MKYISPFISKIRKVLGKKITIREFLIALISFFGIVSLMLVSFYINTRSTKSQPSNSTNTEVQGTQENTSDPSKGTGCDIKDPDGQGLSLGINGFDPEVVCDKNVDMYVSEDWKPDGIAIDRAVDMPIYNVKAGSLVKDSTKLGNGNILSWECPVLTQEDLDNLPNYQMCSIRLNDKVILDKELRADIACKVPSDYSLGTHSSGCTELIGVVLYKDNHLDASYLFPETDYYSSSVNYTTAFKIQDDQFISLMFDFRDHKILGQYVRGGNYSDVLYMVFTDSSKKDFRIVVQARDSLTPTKWYVWEVQGDTLHLENKALVQ